MINSKKPAIMTIFAAVLVLSLLLSACGNGGDTPVGDSFAPDVSEPENSATDAPEASPDNSEPEIEIVIPVAGMGTGTVSVAGTYYQGKQCIYSLPDGLSCWAYQETVGGEGFSVMWEKDWVILNEETGRTVSIAEFHKKVMDFETLTAEQWFLYCYASQEVDPNVKDLAIEKAFVDGCPAVRLTYRIEVGVDSGYSECWVIDAPNGTIVCIFVNLELWGNQDDYSKWVADIISTVRVNN